MNNFTDFALTTEEALNTLGQGPLRDRVKSWLGENVTEEQKAQIKDGMASITAGVKAGDYTRGEGKVKEDVKSLFSSVFGE